MTINEAIAHAMKVAEQNDAQAEKWREEGGEEWGKTTTCRECAADHRQLAEWLMELKDLRAEQNDQYVFIHELMSELKEAKRLLKAAVEDLEKIAAVDECSFPYCDSRCPFECMGQCEGKHWKHLDEALKLIGDERNEP